MGYAAIASLEEHRHTQSRAKVRQQLHQQFDRWLDTLEQDMKQSKPTLSQLTEAVFHRRQELTQYVTEGLLHQAYAAEQQQKTAHCPTCRQPLRARKNVERVVETMIGPLSLSRPYFYCGKCRKGFSPLDEALDVAPRRKQLDLQRAMVSLTKEVPYETARELFEELTGLSASVHTAHAVTNEVAEGLGVLEVSPQREEMEARIATVAHGKQERPIVVLGIDGAHVPTRPETAKGKRPGRKKVRAKRACWHGEWREAKGFRFYVVDTDRIVHLLSWHQIQEDEELFAALQQVKEAGLIPEERIRLCVVADGAPWIWKRITTLFPMAQEVLDYYHCSTYIHRIAEAQYGERPAKALEWVEATMARLFCQEIAGVIWGLERMQPRTEEAATQITKGLRYLYQHRERINYGALRTEGYPIGSGGIESANKFVCHVRLKRSGAWWYVANSNRILALRCAKYNGTFDRIFARYKK